MQASKPARLCRPSCKSHLARDFPQISPAAAYISQPLLKGGDSPERKYIAKIVCRGTTLTTGCFRLKILLRDIFFIFFLQYKILCKQPVVKVVNIILTQSIFYYQKRPKGGGFRTNSAETHSKGCKPTRTKKHPPRRDHTPLFRHYNTTHAMHLLHLPNELIHGIVEHLPCSTPFASTCKRFAGFRCKTKHALERWITGRQGVQHKREMLYCFVAPGVMMKKMWNSNGCLTVFLHLDSGQLYALGQTEEPIIKTFQGPIGNLWNEWMQHILAFDDSDGWYAIYSDSDDDDDENEN